MLEFLLLIIFAFSFALFGVSFLSVAVVVGISFAFMLIIGMLGLLIRMLPWLIIVGLIVFWLKRQRT